MTNRAKEDANAMVFSARALARHLGFSERTVRRLDSSGRLPAPVRIGRSVRWLRSDIEGWLDAGTPDRKKWNQMEEGGQ
ncbi:MAG: helix-turn-helix domain-containing protein [Phycisphaerales bacterium]|nr:MAG: helix-turn-helix domain-containing protein [Phycisphaerales bacterium]